MSQKEVLTQQRLKPETRQTSCTGYRSERSSNTTKIETTGATPTKDKKTGQKEVLTQQRLKPGAPERIIIYGFVSERSSNTTKIETNNPMT